MATTTRYYATSTYFPNSGTKLPYVDSSYALTTTGSTDAIGFSSKNGSPYELGLKFNFSSLPSNAVITKLQVGLRAAMSNYTAGINYFTCDTFIGSISTSFATSFRVNYSPLLDINTTINKQYLIDNAYVLISAISNTTAEYNNSVDYAFVDVTYELGPVKIYRGDALVTGMRCNDLHCIVRRGDYLL